MRQNQTINPFPQSRQIGKGGGILNTLYEIGYWNRIITFERKKREFDINVAEEVVGLPFCHQDVGIVAVN